MVEWKYGSIVWSLEQCNGGIGMMWEKEWVGNGYRGVGSSVGVIGKVMVWVGMEFEWAVMGIG